MTETISQKEKQRARLIGLLKELFQLDQPDLDFGFYKIMHAKAGQVSDFLEKDLLTIIKDSFGEADEVQVAEARAAYEAAKKQAADFGAPDPEATEPVKKAKAAFEAAKDSGSNEGDVYDHLYRFFERYYDGGDFMSRRYFARETDGKAAPYAVPYDGREVYLHWANRDQYYIKTSDYLTNFTFDLLKSEDLAEGVKKQAGVESLSVLNKGQQLGTYVGDLPNYFFGLELPYWTWAFFVLDGVLAEELKLFAAEQGISISEEEVENCIVQDLYSFRST